MIGPLARVIWTWKLSSWGDLEVAVERRGVQCGGNGVASPILQDGLQRNVEDSSVGRNGVMIGHGE